jgi:hypothetical protein
LSIAFDDTLLLHSTIRGQKEKEKEKENKKEKQQQKAFKPYMENHPEGPQNPFVINYSQLNNKYPNLVLSIFLYKL